MGSKFFAVAVLAVVLMGAFAAFLRPPTASAAGASLYVGPASGTFIVGSTFTVSLYLNTGGQSVNAIQANLTFPPNLLQVVSPSSGQSVIQVWVDQPSYSNVNGTLHFQGAIPTPGINTDAGLLSTVMFRVMATGNAAVSIVDSKVLLNDGNGTDALSQTTNGIYNLVLPPPEGPIVTSPTNPDQDKWYHTGTVALEWEAPDGTQGYSYMLNDNPIDEPDDISKGTQTQVSYDNLADGTYYFHIKALRANSWGGVTSFVVHVDNTPPAAFTVDILPSAITPNQNPIIQFGTTDAASGIDHYELEAVPLNQPAANATTPLFIEAASPYSQQFNYGDYDIVVRAFDLAGNYTQETTRLSVVLPGFEFISSQGLRLAGRYTVPWIYLGILALLILIILILLLRRLLRRHRDLDRRLAQGAAAHPEIAEKLEELKQKQKEFEEMVRKMAVVLLCLGFAWGMIGANGARAIDGNSAIGQSGTSTNPTNLTINPPIINLAPTSISNDQVLYLGGWANVPDASVVITIERTETGETFTGAAQTGADGNWFYSFPQLLDSGHYVAWAQLEVAGQSSAPSARVDVSVEPTALQIGGLRFGYQGLYLFLAILFLIAFLLLLVSIIYHARKFRVKKARFEELIRNAEESVRRGFSVLRRDIELELATVAKAKLEGELSLEEKSREEKLTHDLEAVDRYVGKEIWKVEEEEKEL